MGVVPVDPDTIELALPPAVAGSTKGFDILEFQVGTSIAVDCEDALGCWLNVEYFGWREAF